MTFRRLKDYWVQFAAASLAGRRAAHFDWDGSAAEDADYMLEQLIQRMKGNGDNDNP